MEYENKKIEKKIGKVLYSLLDEYNKEADEYEKKGIDLKHNESNEYWGGFSMGVITAVKLIYMLLLKEGIEVKLEKSNDENIIKR